jgi:hypothetical protein
MQWIPPQEERELGWQKQKTSSQEEIGTNNESEEVGKGDTQEDPFKEMDKGKSSPASFVESLVTLQGIADRKEIIKAQVAPLATPKYPREPDKLDRKKATFE